MSDDPKAGLNHAEKEEVDELAAPRAPVIYEVVRRHGEEELRRPSGSLFWSGVAAGLAMTTSVVAQGALRNKLPPDMPGREVVSELGYSLGFIMVILGRMQLFTEQTVVAVLPLMSAPDWNKLWVVARLWAIVFVANMIGTCAAAIVNVHLHLVSLDLLGSMLAVSDRLLQKAPMDVLLQGVPAGFLIASVAWIRAGASDGELWIVLAMSYAIVLGDFTHVVAGAAETFLLLTAGHTSVVHALGGIILPALVGNIIGGTGLFALLAHAQVRQEL